MSLAACFVSLGNISGGTFAIHDSVYHLGLSASNSQPSHCILQNTPSQVHSHSDGHQGLIHPPHLLQLLEISHAGELDLGIARIGGILLVVVQCLLAERNILFLLVLPLPDGSHQPLARPRSRKVEAADHVESAAVGVDPCEGALQSLLLEVAPLFTARSRRPCSPPRSRLPSHSPVARSPRRRAPRNGRESQDFGTWRRRAL